MSKQSKHSSSSAAVSGRGSASRRANFLCQRATSGAPSAMRCAVARASAATSASGTTRVTRPFSFASAASKMRPSSSSSSVTARPTSATSGAISAYAITSPRFLIGAPNRLDAPQIRRSQSAAISSPPPTQMPWICATSGCRQAASARAVACITAPYAIACALFARSVANSPMSLPGENAFSPAPRTMMQRTRVVGRKRVDRRAQLAPHRLGERVELRRPVEDDGGDRAVADDVDRLAHRCVLRVASAIAVLTRPPQRSGASENPADQRPEQQDERQRRDRADEPVRPEHAQVAAGADHRQAERVLGAIAEHQRERERRERDADLLEHVADDAEQQHQPDVEHRVLDRVRADRARHDDHRRDGGERNAQDGGEDRHRGQHDHQPDDVAEIHRRDEAPHEVLVLDEQQRSGVESPDHQAAQQDRRGARARNAEREHRQQRRRSRTRAPPSRARTRLRCVPCRSSTDPWRIAWPGCSP